LKELFWSNSTSAKNRFKTRFGDWKKERKQVMMLAAMSAQEQGWIVPAIPLLLVLLWT
jgi:hypothetical protein